METIEIIGHEAAIMLGPDASLESRTIDLEESDPETFRGFPPLPILIAQKGDLRVLCCTFPEPVMTALRAKRPNDPDRMPSLLTSLANDIAILTLLTLGRAKASRFLVHAEGDAADVRSRLESDHRVVRKHLLLDSDTASPEAVRNVLELIPGLGSIWNFQIPATPSWITRIALDPASGLMPLEEIDLEMAAGPGLIILNGGTASGKTRLLDAVERAVSQRRGSLEIETTEDLPTSPLSRLMSFSVRRMAGDSDDEATHRFRYAGNGTPRSFPSGVSSSQGKALHDEVVASMARWRKAMKYGEPDGSLPPYDIGRGLSECEALGRTLAANALLRGVTAPVWPGLVIDCALETMDTLRQSTAIEEIVGAARFRQVIVSTRNPDLAKWLRRTATERGVEAAVCDLNAGSAVLKNGGGPSPALKI